MYDNQDLINRLKKRFQQLTKWAKRDAITCFRVYERDIPEWPATVDWLDGKVVVWCYPRTRDDTDALKLAYREAVVQAIQTALNLSESDIYVKDRARQSGASQQYERLSTSQSGHTVMEAGLTFELNLSDYLDVGLFLDHRKTRALCRKMSAGKRVLNLFAYTGSFTCYAIDGGAKSTTTVDMSAKYIDWAERNLVLNGLDGRACDRFVVDNCLSFIKLEASKNRYDVIICDPPTFSNSKKMKGPFSINTDYRDLLRSCLKLLSPGGHIIFSTNSRSFKLDSAELPQGLTIVNWTHKTQSEDFKGKPGHQAWLIQKSTGEVSHHGS